MQIFSTLIKAFSILLLFNLSLSAQEKPNQMKAIKKQEIAFLLFDNYETLDVFGPAEIFGRLTDLYTLKFYSMDGGIVTNRHQVPIMTEKLADINKEPFAFLIPGGLGTRVEVENDELITSIKNISLSSSYVMTVCTGSALLAKSGLLDKRQATSNKRAFAWVVTNGPGVKWDKQARWKVDENYYTSSGVSAGMDMALGFLADRHGLEFARNVAWEIEYNWVEDKDNDTFTAK
ncbi:DJ-1/PfpI family protein [Maribacter sp. SA7]|uniref:DJ-1/PfpI family protein n=1 Tax=Maribacter zhoushanensis TaxID=3030012 RepID=UPI0023ECC402|nr:DJ-1/PfpI family protein [Maribacter zhoushanensis]MDF4203147.1 DJ-1/PfpI family protein [Maribacter zhoushanensis]